MMKSMLSLVLLASAPALTLAGGSEYFTGDGTAYTLGDTSSGNCNMMSALSFATTDYAALNNDQWNGHQHCGRCAEVTCGDSRCADQTKSVVVQILDRCPECKHGDLDLSPSVFKTLTGSHPSRYTIKWKFVDCPVSGNVNYCLKGGSSNYWTAIQPTNVATGVTSLKINGKATKMLDGAYYYVLDGAGTSQKSSSSVSVSLTDINGVSMTDKVSLAAGSCSEGSQQFPSGGIPSPPSTNTSIPTSAPKPTSATSTMTKVPTVITKAPITTPATPSYEQQTSAPVPTTSTPKKTTLAPVATDAPTWITQQSGSDDDASQIAQQTLDSASEDDVSQQASDPPTGGEQYTSSGSGNDVTQTASSDNGDNLDQNIQQDPESPDAPPTVVPPTLSSSGSQQSGANVDGETEASSSGWDTYLDCGSASQLLEQNPSTNGNPDQESQIADDNTQEGSYLTGSKDQAVDQTASLVGADVDAVDSQSGSANQNDEDQTDQNTSSDAGADTASDTPEQANSTSNENAESETTEASTSTGTANCPM